MAEALTRWRTARKLAFTTGAEGIAQAVAAASGFLIVHHLPKDVYAEYTFLVACAALLAGLSDIGFSHCYLPIVGRRTGDVSWVISACSHVFRKRWRLLLPAAVLVVPYWLVISVRHGWIDTDYLLASLASVVGVGLMMREQLSRTVMTIFREVQVLNRINVVGSCSRLVLIVLVLMFVPAWALLPCLMIATAAATAVFLAQYRHVPLLKGLPGGVLDPPDVGEVDGRVKAIITPLVLPALFYQFQGTITIMLVSLIGASSAIAEVGALTRPTLILTVVDRAVAILLFPAVASSAPGAPLTRLLVRAHVAYLLAMAALFASSVLLPQYWILLIGEQYAAQQHLLWMAFLPAILMNGSGFAFTTLSSRGITSGQGWVIPLVLAAQCTYLVLFNVSTAREALQFAIVSALVFFIFQYTSMIVRLSRARAG